MVISLCNLALQVSDERSPIAAVKELQKHRERRRTGCNRETMILVTCHDTAHHFKPKSHIWEMPEMTDDCWELVSCWNGFVAVIVAYCCHVPEYALPNMSASEFLMNSW